MGAGRHLKGFGQASLSGAHCGYMPPRLKIKQDFLSLFIFVFLCHGDFPSINGLKLRKTSVSQQGYNAMLSNPLTKKVLNLVI